MERVICDRCGRRQPVDWVPGDLCVACGASARAEIRCAWCAEWTPAGKYCRSCGCEVVDRDRYGAARMLKSAGVDQFSIPDRLRSLDPEQIANFGRIYNAQWAIVSRRVEEVRLCETYLLQREFSKRLEDEWTPRLPLDKENLSWLASGPEGPFVHRPELLPEIAAASPIDSTRVLASIALLRTGCLEPPILAGARSGLKWPDADLALEAALAFAHWRARTCPHPLGVQMAQLVSMTSAIPRGSPLAPWAAALAVFEERGRFGSLPPVDSDAAGDTASLRESLRQGLSASDPDLRFTCAIALGECELLSGALDSHDPQQRLTALLALANHQSAAIAPYLISGPQDMCERIIEQLRDVQYRHSAFRLSDALVEAVLTALELGGDRVRETGWWLLSSNLTPKTVRRLAALAARERDGGIFAGLLKQQELPAVHEVVRAMIQSGLFYLGHFYENPQHIDFDDEAVAGLVQGADSGAVLGLLTIAGRQAEYCLERGLEAGAAGRFLIRMAFEPGTAGIRERAYSLLQEYDRKLWNWMTPSGSQSLFGTPVGFLRILTRVLRDNSGDGIRTRLLRDLSDCEAASPSVTEDTPELAACIDALEELTRDNSSSDAHYAARVLARSGRPLPHPETPALAPPEERPPAIAVVEETPAAAAPTEDLDHAVLLPGTALPTLADYVGMLGAFQTGTDPVSALAKYGLTLDSYVQAVSRWGELLGSRDDLCVRYAQLMSQAEVVERKT